MGDHPPFSVLNGYVQRKQEKLGITKVENERWHCVHYFDNKPFIMKAWTPDIDFSKEQLFSIPIWIKMPGLEFKY